jgi:hypothetical protein
MLVGNHNKALITTMLRTNTNSTKIWRLLLPPLLPPLPVPLQVLSNRHLQQGRTPSKFCLLWWWRWRLFHVYLWTWLTLQCGDVSANHTQANGITYSSTITLYYSATVTKPRVPASRSTTDAGSSSTSLLDQQQYQTQTPGIGLY